MIEKELIHKTETDSKISKPNLWLPKGKRWGEGLTGRVAVGHTHTATHRMGWRQGPTAWLREICSGLCGGLYGGRREKAWIHMPIYVADSLCCTSETDPPVHHCKSSARQ